MIQTIISKAKAKKLIFMDLSFAWDKLLQLQFGSICFFKIDVFVAQSLSTIISNLLGQFLLSIIFFGTRLDKDWTKKYFSGDLSCSFWTIPLTIAAHSPSNCNFFVKLAWWDESKVLVAVGNLTDSGGKWFVFSNLFYLRISWISLINNGFPDTNLRQPRFS